MADKQNHKSNNKAGKQSESTPRSAAQNVLATLSASLRGIKKLVTGGSALKSRSTVASQANTTAPHSMHKSEDMSENSNTSETNAPVSRQTKTGAMTQDITSEDVHTAMLKTGNSEDVLAESLEKVPSATDVKEHFFEDERRQVSPPPPQAARELPDEYGDTKLVLMVRDPEWIYAYWEVNDATREQIGLPRNGDHKSRVVLRLYKITDTNWPAQAAHYFFDVDVPSNAKNWYLHMPEANQQWCAELGLIDQAENYTSICRSNRIATPRNTISDRIDSEWMTVEESFEKITRLSRASLEAHLRGDANAATSEAILRTINRQLTAVLHEGKTAMSSGIFSSESALPQNQKSFWMQVHTELLLYGATTPDAKVTVQGRPIELNDDGTFSMRFALPDGLQVLEVKAVNADGDLEESVTPVVERTTRQA